MSDDNQFDAETMFATPRELAGSPDIGREQKIAALKDWRALVRRRLDSADEGMMPVADPRPDLEGPIVHDSELLHDIEVELAKLERAQPT